MSQGNFFVKNIRDIIAALYVLYKWLPTTQTNVKCLPLYYAASTMFFKFTFLQLEKL